MDLRHGNGGTVLVVGFRSRLDLVFHSLVGRGRTEVVPRWWCPSSLSVPTGVTYRTPRKVLGSRYGPVSGCPTEGHNSSPRVVEWTLITTMGTASATPAGHASTSPVYRRTGTNTRKTTRPQQSECRTKSLLRPRPTVPPLPSCSPIRVPTELHVP